jgi:ATP-dependent exoDNAse (exonuclease V) beta subunit
MINYLAKKHPHKRDAHIVFDEGPHIYTVDGDSDFTSVTTMIHKHFAKFDADKIIRKMMSGRNWMFSKYFGMTMDEIKASWDKNRDEAAAAGTKMHYDIECFYNNMPIDNDSVEYGYFKEFKNEFSHLNPFRTEWMVWDKELKIAGSIDMLYENPDGSLTIYDWKRCKQIKKDNKWQSSTTPFLKHLPDTNFWHYSLQLNIYKFLLEKNYNRKVNGLFLVCMHPNNKNESYIRLEVPDLQKEVDNIMSLRMVTLAS